jgi:hypothetical protein
VFPYVCAGSFDFGASRAPSSARERMLATFTLFSAA